MAHPIRVNLVSESEISVQGHGVHTAYIEMVNALRRSARIELITGEFGRQVPCDIIHLHTLGPRVWRKIFQKGPKKVISAHVVPDSFVGSLVLARYWKFLATWYLRWIYNRADMLIAVSDETKRSLLAMGVRAPIQVMYNSIDTAPYRAQRGSPDELRSQLGIAADAFVVIGAGQVQPRKRVDDFLAAAKALPDVHFVWVGGMPFGKAAAGSRQLESMMRRAPANVSFPGVVALDDMPAYYQAADMFWLPSEQETFGLVVVEAAAAGLPIMLRDISDYDETFGEDALRKKTPEEFHQAILELRSTPLEYRKWQKRAQRIANRFDSKVAAKTLVNLYTDLVK